MRRIGRALRPFVLLRHALASMLAHDALNLAQSAAYSALVALFPGLIVAAAAVTLLPDASVLKSDVSDFFGQVLPADVLPLLGSYFVASPRNPHTARALVLAVLVSLIGASSVIATLMEGMRRAENLPNNSWTFWQRRRRALLLVPLSLLPLGVASVLVVFGQLITAWIVGYLSPAVQPVFYGLALAIRWTVSLAGVAALTALIYHAGTPKQQRWTRTLPGAVVATAIWFVTTLAFGWYVTRFANYTQVYGSLGAGVALLFWLYIVVLSVLCGAEFNVQFHRTRPGAAQGEEVLPARQTIRPPNAAG